MAGCQNVAIARCTQCNKPFCATHGGLIENKTSRCLICQQQTFDRILAGAARTNHLDAAVDTITVWAQGDNASPVAQRALGLLYAHLGNWEAALSLLKTLPGASSNSSTLDADLAQVYLQRGAQAITKDNLLSAATDIVESLRLNPQLADAQRILPFLRNWQVLAQIRAGEVVAASSVWEIQFEQEPTNLTLIHHLGILYYRIASEMETMNDKISKNGYVKSPADTKTVDAFWRKTIAHWAVILRNSSYWDEWRQQRFGATGIALTDEDIVAARNNMEERLLRDFRDYASNCESAGKTDDAARFHEYELLWGLELHTTKLMRECVLEYAVKDWPHGLGCGPIMLERLGKLTASKNLVAGLRRAALSFPDGMGHELSQYISAIGRYCYLINENYLDQAVTELEKVSAWPQTKELYTTALCAKAQELAQLGQWDEALSIFEKAQHNGANLSTHYLLIANGSLKRAKELLAKDDDHGPVIRLLELALKLLGDNAEIKQNLAAVYAQKARIANNADHYEEAAEYIRIALKYDPSEPQTKHWARVTMANLAGSIVDGNPDRAISLLKEALTYEQDEQVAKMLSHFAFNHSVTLARAKNRERAVTFMRDFIQYNPEAKANPTIDEARETLQRFFLVEASENAENNQFSQAIDLVKEALNYLDDSTGRGFLAQLLLKAGRYDEGIKTMQDAVNRDRSNKELRHSLCVMLHNRGIELANQDKYDQAINYLRQALQIESDPATKSNLSAIYKNRAVERINRGDRSGAISDLRDALNYNPSDYELKSLLNRIN